MSPSDHQRSSTRPSNVRVVSALAADAQSFNIEDRRVLRALATAEDHHFWFKSRNAFIEARLHCLGLHRSARFLELGCGGGVVAAQLARTGFDVIGVDGHLERILEAAARAPASEFIVHDLTRGLEELGFGAEFDVVGLFDVIEHLADPRSVLAAAARCAKRGGWVVGTVPALMSLWTAVDERAGHKLRYDRDTLRAALRGVAGLVVFETVDFNRHLVPALWMQRHFLLRKSELASGEQSLRVPPTPINRALLAASALERFAEPLLSKLPLPGASLWFALRVVG